MRRILAGLSLGLLLAILPAGFAQQATIKTTSQEVLLDMVVRDKKGHLVKDLKPDEISITEDGVPQPIRSLRLRTGAEISTIQTSSAGGTQTAPQSAPVTAAAPNPLRDLR